jgi:oligopeptide/dipeptide ABC transporter ATP-binding protein
MSGEAAAAAAAPLVSVMDVSKHFPVRQGFMRKSLFKAVDNVSFTVRKGETLGLVGESGSGKSTLGRVILNLLPATAGSIRIADRDVTGLRGTARRGVWRYAQMVFQDPYSSLNPKMTIRDTLAEPLRNFGIAQGTDAEARVLKALEDCGLSASALDLYPREFSGGQRQRIGIARALIVRPDFIVADEPVSALDVSIQAQIINLFQDLQAEYGLTYLFIAHDLAVVRQIANRVAVMYRGNIVELAGADALYQRPLHPYTQLLLRSIPIPDPVLEARRVQGGTPNESVTGTVSKGCPFSPRCPRAQFPLCGDVAPALEAKQPEHSAACHFTDRVPG